MFVSIRSGVKPVDVAVIDRLAAEGLGADDITIDIAHGQAESVRRMIGHIKAKLPQAFVIAGKVGTPKGVIDLEHWGADATQVGIDPDWASLGVMSGRERKTLRLSVHSLGSGNFRRPCRRRSLQLHPARPTDRHAPSPCPETPCPRYCHCHG